MSSLPDLSRTDTLMVHQIKELTEVFTDWETANRYRVETVDGREVMFAAETGGGMGSALMRQFFGSARPFHLEARDPSGQTVLVAKRPFTWMFSRLEVLDGMGTQLGTVQRRFAFLHRRYALLDPTGAEVAELSGPFWKPWTFELSIGGRVVGAIKKKWSGLGKEVFTDADTFGVTFDPMLGQQDKMLLLAATFLIDFTHFESSD